MSVGASQITVTFQEVNRSTLETLWRALEQSSSPSLFLSWQWIGTWLDTVPSSHKLCMLLAAHSDRVVGAAIFGDSSVCRHHLFRSHGLWLHETGDSNVDVLGMEYNSPLIETGLEEPVLAAMIDYLIHQMQDIDEFTWSGLERGAPLHTALTKPRELTVETSRSDPSFYIDLKSLQAKGAEFDSTLSANTRSRIRRGLKELQRHGEPQVAIASSVEQAHQFLEELRVLHQGRWQARGSSGAFGPSFFGDFHKEFIKRSFADGLIQLTRISFGTKVLGYLYNMLYRDIVLNYQSGFDLSDSKISSGLICHYLAIEQARKSGAHVYDLLAGRNQLKESLATHSGQMEWLVLQRPRLRFSIERQLRAIKRSLSGKKHDP